MTAIKYLVAACVLALGVGSAQANVVDVFELNGGILGSGTSSPLGSVAIDTATAEIEGFGLFGTPDESTLGENTELELFSYGNSFGYDVYNPVMLGHLFSFTVTLENLQPGYMGGPFRAVLDARGVGEIFFEGMATKLSARPVNPPAEVPLPAAFPLFLTALAGFAAFGWLRRRPVLEGYGPSAPA